MIGRADMLAALGVVGALLGHRKALHADGARKTAWLALVLLATAVGMFSRENAIVAIAILALWDVSFESGAAWRSRVASYAVVAVSSAVFLWARAMALADEPLASPRFLDNPLVGADFWTARVTAFEVIGRYVKLLVWPAALSSDYSYNEVPLFGWKMTSGADWLAAASLLGCLGAGIVAIRAWRDNRPLFFFLIFCAVALAPVSNLVILIGTIMGEGLVYLAAVGLMGCVVCAVELVWRRWAITPSRKQALAAESGGGLPWTGART